MTSVRDTVQALQADLNTRADEVRNDRSRSEAWKTQQLSALSIAAEDAAEDAVARAKTARADRRRQLERQLFGTGDLAGDPASLAISRRDAIDRAARLGNERDALALLARAEASGDTVLSRAVVQVAVEQRWMGVANTWLDDHGHGAQHNDNLSELWHMTAPEGSSAQARETLNFALCINPPVEVAGLSRTQREQLAKGDPEQAEAAAKATAERSEQAHLMARGHAAYPSAGTIAAAALAGQPTPANTMPLNGPGITNTAATAVGGQVVTNLD